MPQLGSSGTEGRKKPGLASLVPNYKTKNMPKGGWPDDVEANENFARRMAADAGLQQRASITGRNQIRQSWDEPNNKYLWHFSPQENFNEKGDIQTRGLSAGKAKGFSQGVHFSPKPDYPVAGDRPMNAYRIERDKVPNLMYREGSDYHTLSDIPAEHMQVAVDTPQGLPTKFSSLSEAYGITPALGMLYNLLGATGIIPTVQTPDQWVFNDMMRNSPIGRQLQMANQPVMLT
jgi:hypothetical protein